MKAISVLFVGVLGFAAGLGTGLMWKRPADGGPKRVPEAPAQTKSDVRERHRQEESVRLARVARERQAAQDAARESAKARMRNFNNAKSLIDGAMQLADDKLREESIGRIRAAILSGDEAARLAGLTAFNGIQELDFDKASFRGAILPLVESTSAETRSAACFALMSAGLEPGDAERLRGIADRMGLGDGTSYFLFRLEKGDLTGESGEIVRRLLGSGQDSPVRESLRGIWGARLSPELEADIITLSQDPAFLHDAVYFALSTQQNKSAACIARLIEVLGDADSYNNGGRAAWGLAQGVAPGLAPPVAEAALKIVSTRSSGYLQQEAWNLVSRYAGPDQLATLKELAAKPNLSPERRELVEKTIRRIESAPAGP